MTLLQVLVCLWFGGSLAMACQVSLVHWISSKQPGLVTPPLYEVLLGTLVWPLGLYFIARDARRSLQEWQKIEKQRRAPDPPPAVEQKFCAIIWNWTDDREWHCSFNTAEERSLYIDGVLEQSEEYVTVHCHEHPETTP